MRAAMGTVTVSEASLLARRSASFSTKVTAIPLVSSLLLWSSVFSLSPNETPNLIALEPTHDRVTVIVDLLAVTVREPRETARRSAYVWRARAYRLSPFRL